MTTDTTWASTPATANGNWSMFHFTTAQGGPLVNYCVAAHKDCQKVFIYKYDMTDTSAGFGACTEARYIAEERLEPGDRGREAGAW
jgi:hypothetical protein